MNASVEGLLRLFRGRTPIRGGSLIVTIFGDAVVPRGGSLSLASLTDIMRAFDVSDGMVRTALSRLVSEGWFERSKHGRHTFYALSPRGRATFVQATRRIYDGTPARWDGRFVLLLADSDARVAPRALLAAEGFGVLTPGLLVTTSTHAATDRDGGALRLIARAEDEAAARRLAARAWPIGDIGARYRQFIAMFENVRGAIGLKTPFQDMEALVVRILLIHEYRRVILEDPLLPAELLPDPWEGTQARDLCAAIYKALAPMAEHWLDLHATSESGPLPAPEQGFAARFRDIGTARGRDSAAAGSYPFVLHISLDE